MRLSSLAYCGAYRGSFQPHLFFYRVGSSGMFQINGAGGLGENSTGDISVTSGDSCIFPITLRGAASGSKISQKPAHGKLKKLNVATYEYIALPVGALGVAHKRAQGSLLARGRGGKKVAEKHACMRMRVLLQTLFSQWYPEASPIDVGLKISQIVPS